MESLRKLWIAYRMSLQQLLRRRVALTMLLVVPVVFFTLVDLTTTRMKLPIRLAELGENRVLLLSARDETLVFIGLATVGLLAAFLGLGLIQGDTDTYRRLVLCGYRTWQIVIAKLMTLLTAVVLIAVFVAALVPFHFEVRHWPQLAIGYALCGWVYGAYGLLVGAAIRRELEGVLFVVLLVNIDAGWLQNPLYFTNANNSEVIRLLPAYLPSQVSLIAAFTDDALLYPALKALLYGFGLLVAALLLYWLRMRLRLPRFGR